MQMLNGNILVKLNEKKNVDGLISSVNGKSYKQVEVVEPDIDGTVSVGNNLYIPNGSGTEVEINNNKYLCIHIREVILIL